MNPIKCFTWEEIIEQRCNRSEADQCPQRCSGNEIEISEIERGEGYGHCPDDTHKSVARNGHGVGNHEKSKQPNASRRQFVEKHFPVPT